MSFLENTLIFVFGFFAFGAVAAAATLVALVAFKFLGVIGLCLSIAGMAFLYTKIEERL